MPRPPLTHIKSLSLHHLPAYLPPRFPSTSVRCRTLIFTKTGYSLRKAVPCTICYLPSGKIGVQCSAKPARSPDVLQCASNERKCCNFSYPYPALFCTAGVRPDELQGLFLQAFTPVLTAQKYLCKKEFVGIIRRCPGCGLVFSSCFVGLVATKRVGIGESRHEFFT